jgi:hypothetical protein
MRLSPSILVGLILFVSTCGAGRQTVKPDDMSAEQHGREAQHERLQAREQQDSYHPEADRPIPVPDKGYLFSLPVYNPTEGHLFEAKAHEKHARQHEAAARYLQKFEEGECGDFPSSTRAACPLLGPVSEIVDIPGGIRVRLTSGTRADAVVAHMHCHYAFARARAFAENASCPLYVRGIQIKRGRDPTTVEIVAPDAAGESEVRARSREEAVFDKDSKR